MNEPTDSIHDDDIALARVRLRYGDEGIARLKGARVAIIGLGAVGSFALEALARTGIGHLRLIDSDVVSPSNLNRQILALRSTIGRPKADVARERVLQISPSTKVSAHQLFFAQDTAAQILQPPLDAVVDAIDSLGPKVELLATCVKSGLPIFSSMGAADRTDPNKLRTGNLFDAEICPLARLVRKRLRRRGVSDGVWAVWSEEQPQEPAERDGEDDPDPSPFARGRPRPPLPSLAPLPGMFGLALANEVILRVLNGTLGNANI